MLSKANLDQHVNGVKVVGSAPSSNHLFSRMIYSLLFCNANVEECLRQKEILLIYEKARHRGYKINLDKSAVSFSLSTPQGVKQAIANE